MRVARGEEPETLRLYQPDRIVAFGLRDVSARGFVQAAREARALGYASVLRLAGGRAAVFHPDGRHLLVAGQNKWIYVYDIRNGKQVRKIRTSLSNVFGLSLSPRGETIAICGGCRMENASGAGRSTRETRSSSLFRGMGSTLSRPATRGVLRSGAPERNDGSSCLKR